MYLYHYIHIIDFNANDYIPHRTTYVDTSHTLSYVKFIAKTAKRPQIIIVEKNSFVKPCFATNVRQRDF